MSLGVYREITSDRNLLDRGETGELHKFMRSASWASLLVTEIVMPNTRWPLGCSEKKKALEDLNLARLTIQGYKESW